MYIEGHVFLINAHYFYILLYFCYNLVQVHIPVVLYVFEVNISLRRRRVVIDFVVMLLVVFNKDS